MSVSPTLSVSLPKTLLRVSQATGFGSMIFFPDFGGSTIYARTLVAELGREISCLTVRFAPDLIEQLQNRCILRGFRLPGF